MDLARTARIVSGLAVLGAGAAMMVLPGPGVLTVVAGLMVLERDVPVARRALGAFRLAASASRNALRERFGHLAPSVFRTARE